MDFFRRFARSENGSLSVETVICFPLLAWAFIATFVFWDVFYARSINMRSAYVVGDALSRETDYVNAEYIEAMEDLQIFLTKGQYPIRIRVTTVVWDANDNQFEVEWSHAADASWSDLTTVTLQAYKDQIPPLATGDVAIIVESDLAYSPFFSVGLRPTRFADFVVTRPRFGPQLVWENADGTLIVADGEENGDEPVDEGDDA